MLAWLSAIAGAESFESKMARRIGSIEEFQFKFIGIILSFHFLFWIICEEGKGNYNFVLAMLKLDYVMT